MSVEIMTQVWKQSPSSGTQLLIELTLADYANAEAICWPSIKSVAKQARCSEDWVHKVISKMRKEGRIQVEVGGGRAKTNVYKLLFAPINPVFNTPFNGAERVDFVPKKGRLSPERVYPSLPDPSLDPSREPSTTRRGVMVLAERSFGRLLSPTEIELLKALEEEHPYVRIDYAFRQAAEQGVRKLAYVKAICEKQEQNGDSYEPRAKGAHAAQSGGPTSEEAATLERLGIKPREFILDP